MSEQTPPTGPLVGIKVIELAHVMAGPTCGRMLADMGADVIKVERIPDGDDARRDTIAGDAGGNDSLAFIMMNRNKRGIALDLKSPGGKQILFKLLENADVLIENFRHDTMAKLGLGYDKLHERFPRLIYCAVSGFGRTGPYHERGGFDLIAQGMSGLMSITGEGPGRPPVKVGAPATDIAAGILATMGVVAALYNREQTGRGQMVDTSLYEAGITFTYWHSAICFATGDNPGALGSAHPLNTPYQAYETADSWINVGGANQSNWKRLLGVLGDEKLKADSRFADNARRMKNKPALDHILSEHFRQRSTQDWLAALEAAGIPAGPINSVREMHTDPQTLARDMVVSSSHSRLGEVKTIGFPVKFSETPGGVVSGAPIYGEHTRAILAEHGFGPEEIAQFLEQAAAVAADSERAVSEPAADDPFVMPAHDAG
jgi:crotonobetainyl-CoA:carnitine CoA-transferase CaiB-like acyl-CoA transferase